MGSLGPRGCTHSERARMLIDPCLAVRCIPGNLGAHRGEGTVQGSRWTPWIPWKNTSLRSGSRVLSRTPGHREE